MSNPFEGRFDPQNWKANAIVIEDCIVQNLDIDGVGTTVFPRTITVQSPNGEIIRCRYQSEIGLSVSDNVSIRQETDGLEYYVFNAGGSTTGTILTDRLVSPDKTINPVLVADNSGDVTGYADIRAGDTERGLVQGFYFDGIQYNEEAPSDRFNQNSAGIPTGWVADTAAQATDTSTNYGMWFISNTSGNTTSVNRYPTLFDATSTIYTLMVYDVFWNDELWAADIDWYFSVNASTGGGSSVDTGRWVRFHLQWDSSATRFQIRGSDNEGSGATNGAWFVLDQIYKQPLTIGVQIDEPNTRLSVKVSAGIPPGANVATQFASMKTIHSRFGTTFSAYGDVHVQFEENRGTGSRSRLVVGGVGGA